MDRKFIKEYCRKCSYMMDLFGLCCAYQLDAKTMKGIVYCQLVKECPYKAEKPRWFQEEYEDKEKRRKQRGRKNCEESD